MRRRGREYWRQHCPFQSQKRSWHMKFKLGGGKGSVSQYWNPVYQPGKIIKESSTWNMCGGE